MVTNESSWREPEHPDPPKPKIWNPNFDLDGTGITNADRAFWVHDAYLAYHRSTRMTSVTDTDIATGLQDLLTDLMHLCDREGVCFESLVESAKYHHFEERGPQRNLHEDEGG